MRDWVLKWSCRFEIWQVLQQEYHPYTCQISERLDNSKSGYIPLLRDFERSGVKTFYSFVYRGRGMVTSALIMHGKYSHWFKYAWPYTSNLRTDPWQQHEALSPWDDKPVNNLKSTGWRSPNLPYSYNECDGHGFCDDDVIKWKHFRITARLCREIHRSPVNSPRKGQWHGALMLSLIYAWTNGWVNNRDAGDLRYLRAQYVVFVMLKLIHLTI